MRLLWGNNKGDYTFVVHDLSVYEVFVDSRGILQQFIAQIDIALYSEMDEYE